MIKLIIKTKTHKYPIIIGKKLIKKIPTIFKKNYIKFNKCLLIIDKKVPSFFTRKIINSISKKKIYIINFNANEKNKNHKNVNKILNVLLKNNFHRNDCLISLGGGITGDVSGFAASIFKRGIKFINIPTTLLAQVDSSIGGKTGINSKFGKNLIGTFYQPDLVISDIDFLKSLSKRELICGYGEILKHSLIANKKFNSFLNLNGSKILNLQTPYIEKSIYQSCLIKKKIIEIDEKENGLRKILNFGHTFAHAYEATMGYSKKLNHGEAVILGIASASHFSNMSKFLKKNDFNSIINNLTKLNLPNDINKFFTKKSLNKIISFMKKDKKNNSNKINLVLLKKIGKPVFNLSFDEQKIFLFMKKKLFN
jgi:3-dehydroquinate synthase